MLQRALLLAFLVALTVAVSSPWMIYAQPQAAATQEERVPAFNPTQPPKSTDLAPILGKGQLWGNNDQYPFQEAAREHFADVQARHNGLAGPGVVGKQVAKPLLLEHVIVHRDPLVRERVDLGNFSCKCGICEVSE